MGAAEGLTHEWQDADAFLRALGDRHTFQTFGEGDASGRRNLSRILHGTLANHADELARLNRLGAGVYVMVNEGDGLGRKTENVKRIRAYVLDLDGSPLAPVLAAPLSPHAIVETSPNRWHVYWWIESAPLGEFKRVQRALAERFSADVKVCDLPRVMRLPGFMHQKHAPFEARLDELREGPRYTHAEFVAAFGVDMPLSQLPQRKALQSTIHEGERNNTLYELARGFARKGLPATGISDRLQRINAERCLPPLCSTEVDAISNSASSAGSTGFTMLLHSLQDSPEWKALPAASCAISLALFRQYNGSNNGRLALPWRDFEGQHGIATSRRFYRYLRHAVNAGILIQVTKQRNTQSGCIPALYAIPERFLAQVSKQHTAPSVKRAQLSK